MENLLVLASSARYLRVRKRYWAVGIPSLLLVMLLGYVAIDYYSLEGGLAWGFRSPQNRTRDAAWVLPRPAVNGSHLFPSYASIPGVSRRRNLSGEELRPLTTWGLLSGTECAMPGVPGAAEAVREGGEAWRELVESMGEGGGGRRGGRKCPYSVRRMNSSEFGGGEFRLGIPCGLVEGSSVTLIGTPGGSVGEFRVDLVGARFPGGQEPPIVLHYNVRLRGDRTTAEPVIVQNTWTADGDWGREERCPAPDHESSGKVDELEQCSRMVGQSSTHTRRNGPDTRRYFPFRQGYLAIATLSVGMEGIQVAVDGKHITSFAYRDKLEPWLVNEVKVSGDIQLLSMVANGLPVTEDTDSIINLDALRSPNLPLHKPLFLFIGIFSTANNFKRRMAIRRTWLQYSEVKSGEVAARFFVGLHKNQVVNKELWHEAMTYGDIQLTPFVDYYNLITWKTVSICIYSTNIVSAKYVMKTDDDSFVRIDEVLSSLKGKNVIRGLLYGLIAFNDQPQRDPDGKWFVSIEEWPYENYPPWAHGPGYIVSYDIAETISDSQKNGSLWMFKLEDVAMGIWIAQMKNNGREIQYETETRIHMEGCEPGYIVAHYQGPRDMLCLWQTLLQSNKPTCCNQS